MKFLISTRLDCDYNYLCQRPKILPFSGIVKFCGTGSCQPVE